MTDDDTRRILEEWASLLTEELGLAGTAVDIDSILRLAGVAAHSVIRPAAPVTTYIVGYAAGMAAAGASLPAEPATRAEAVARDFGDRDS